MVMYKIYKYAVTIIYSDFYYKHIVKRKPSEINNNQNFESTSCITGGALSRNLHLKHTGMAWRKELER